MRLDMFCEIKCLIDKLIDVDIYDLTKRIYQRALRKGFHKTSLCHLDLHFKNPIFQDHFCIVVLYIFSLTLRIVWETAKL